MAKAQLTNGMVLDGFRLEQRLHRGGMADIWRVSRGDIDLPIVMKVPFLDFESDLALLVGFEVEQMIMAELKGQHVPRWIANGDFTQQPYIVMEYIAGPTLAEAVRGGPLPVAETIERGIRIATALSDLHSQRVLHLDLKPANVMFRPDGTAVLIDFGLSRHLHLPDLLEEQFHRPAGTAEYMAPEQLLRVRSDPRSDLFALGVILYQLLTGVLPFGAPSRIRHVRQRVWQQPTPPMVHRPECPPALQEIILKCLEPMPDRRYASADELAFDLRHPDLVALTERAERQEREGTKATFLRWLSASQTMREIQRAAAKPPPRPPIILVALDLRPGLDDMHQAQMEAAASALANTPGARLACLNALQTKLLGIDENVDADGENIHVQRMRELRQWAEPLGLPRGKITFHLIEARSIAAGIVEFAKANSVDQIVIGAPTPGRAGSKRIAAQVMHEAPCTVTVVRQSRRGADEGIAGEVSR